jgi:2'-5' RNA ligase
VIRLFAALAIPEAAAEALSPLCRGLAGADWVSPEDLHITLRFAGEVPEDQADDLDAALGAVRSAPFDITLAGVGAFGDAAGAHAIWAGVEAGEALKILRQRCERAARRAGLAPDTRLWKPHVTLARTRGAELARIAAWSAAHNLTRLEPFTATAFGLYSSWRSAGAPRYRLERTYPLRDWPRGP